MGLASRSSPEIEADPGRAAAVARANGVLAGIVGPDDPAEAEWSLVPSRHGDPAYYLLLRSGADEIGAALPPAELVNPDKLWWRCSRAWGDLLGQRTRRLIREVNEALNADGEG